MALAESVNLRDVTSKNDFVQNPQSYLESLEPIMKSARSINNSASQLCDVHASIWTADEKFNKCNLHLRDRKSKGRCWH